MLGAEHTVRAEHTVGEDHPALRAPQVLMVGPAPSGPHSRGGMATVATRMLEIPESRARITVVPTYNDTGALRRLTLGVFGMLRAAVLVLSGRVDVVHVHLSHGGSVLRKSVPLLAARLGGVPTVIHAHSYNFAEWFGGLPAAGGRIVRALLPADRWLILGNDLAVEYRTVLALDPTRVQVLHNPAPAPSQRNPLSHATSGGVVAVALGRLGERKGTFDIIAAVAALPPEVAAKLTVVLAGDDQVAAARAAAAPLHGSVVVRDWLNAAQRDALLDAADIFLLPSYDEGLPMALLEAMAAGLTPVTSPVGAIGDVVIDDENGILVTPGDVENLSAALASLVIDTDRRVRLALAARERAADFSLAGWHDELVSVWQEVLSARSG